MSRNDKRDNRADGVAVTVTGASSFAFVQPNAPQGVSVSLQSPLRATQSAPDPIRAASVPGNSPARRVATAMPGEGPRSLIEQGGYSAPTEARQGDSPSRAGRSPVRSSNLKMAGAPASNSPASSRSPEQVRENPTCKPRPKDNKPKGGGGSGKRFVPWCG